MVSISFPSDPRSTHKSILISARHCVLGGRIVSLKQDSSHLHYRVTWPKTGPKPIATSPISLGHGITSPEDDTESILRSYFALSVPLSSLYKQWAASDANFARRAPSFTGIRILNQDAWETLISFICSSNNHISRISSMVQKLCTYYGPYIGTISGEPFHDFPDAKALSGVQVQTHLRDLGFGYRAKYIVQTADIVANHKPPGWLNGLRNPAVPAFDDPVPPTNTTAKPDSNPAVGDTKPPSEPPTYRAAHEALLTLVGVGPKVSDCVCLMGLGWGESVPVDTHVWQIAQRDYKFGGSGGSKGKTKTLTKPMYDAVGDHFRAIWGPYAGWAQSVLFTANLKSFAEQAEGGKKKKEKLGEEGDGVVKLEDGVPEEGEAEGETVAAAAAVVKIELSEVKESDKKEDVAVAVVENTSKRVVRKRKAEAVETKDTSSGKKRVKTVEVEVTTRRTSQRIRATRK